MVSPLRNHHIDPPFIVHHIRASATIRTAAASSTKAPKSCNSTWASPSTWPGGCDSGQRMVHGKWWWLAPQLCPNIGFMNGSDHGDGDLHNRGQPHGGFLAASAAMVFPALHLNGLPGSSQQLLPWLKLLWCCCQCCFRHVEGRPRKHQLSIYK